MIADWIIRGEEGSRGGCREAGRGWRWITQGGEVGEGGAKEHHIFMLFLDVSKIGRKENVLVLAQFRSNRWPKCFGLCTFRNSHHQPAFKCIPYKTCFQYGSNIFASKLLAGSILLHISAYGCVYIEVELSVSLCRYHFLENWLLQERVVVVGLGLGCHRREWGRREEGRGVVVKNGVWDLNTVSRTRFAPDCFLTNFFFSFLSLCSAERIFHIWGKYVFPPKFL